MHSALCWPQCILATTAGHCPQAKAVVPGPDLCHLDFRLQVSSLCQVLKTHPGLKLSSQCSTPTLIFPFPHAPYARSFLLHRSVFSLWLNGGPCGLASEASLTLWLASRTVSGPLTVFAEHFEMLEARTQRRGTPVTPIWCMADVLPRCKGYWLLSLRPCPSRSPVWGLTWGRAARTVHDSLCGQ